MNLLAKEWRKKVIFSLVITLLGVELLAAMGGKASVHAADGSDSIVMVEDFEDENVIADIKFNPKRMHEATLHLESNPKYVRNGEHSARIDYDMIDIVDNPSHIEVGYQSGHQPISGYPTKVGMWVYGHNEGHLLTTKFRELEGRGSSFQAEFYDADNDGINWTGWKYIEADIPQGKQGPIILELFFQLKQSDMSKKNKGSIWVDDIRFIYGEVDEDNDVPVLTAITPLEDEVLTAPLDELQVGLVDLDSGLDMTSLSVHLDGKDITADVQYSPDTRILSYPGEAVDGGYHVLDVQVRDNNGNPAEKSYAFTIEAGERLSMTAPEEAVSNEIYAVKVGMNDYANADSAGFELAYDPNTLRFEGLAEVNGVAAATTVDDDKGIVQVNLDGISPATADDIVTVNFRVNSAAVLERGEAYKSITMSSSELASGGTPTGNPLATPIRYTIAFPYHLELTGVGIDTATTFTVTDRNNQPFEGADIFFTGLLKQSSVVTITAATTNVYKDDDSSSELLRVATTGQRYYASAEPDDGWFEVILPDGTTSGYIAATDVSSLSLSGSLGRTNAQGQVTTDLATLARGSYQVQAVNGTENSKVVKYDVVEQYGSSIPEYLQTYVAEDLSTQLSAAWQTNSATRDTFIQYIEASEWGEGEEPEVSLVKEQQSESELQVLSLKEKGSKGEIRFHNVLVENLKPNTTYNYRIGYEDAWSTWHSYTTMDQDKATPFSFLYVTDSHTKEDDGLEIYQELMSNAFTQYPSTQFVMHGGDIVDAGGAFDEWKQFWRASSIYATTYPSALTLGNHDVKSEGKDVFTKGANFPVNGPESQMQYAYAYDIDDTHFVVLNSEGTREQMIDQAAWLQEDLEQNDKKWTIAMFHRPAYHTEAGRDTLVEYTQTYFAPILEKMGVDLVLVGHDHVYSRTYPMQEGKPNKQTNEGTVYLDGGASGWKFYDGSKFDYLEEIFDEDVPVYSAIQVTQDEIRVEARTSEGVLIDGFSVTKPKTEVPSLPGTGGGLPTVPTPKADKVLSDKEVTEAIEAGRLVIDLSGEGGTIQIPTGLAALFKQLGDGEVVITVPNQPNIVLSGQELNRLLLDNGKTKTVEIVVEYATQAEQQAYENQIQTSKKTAKAASKAFTVKAMAGDQAASVSYTLGIKPDDMTSYTNLYEIGSDGKLTLVQANVVLSADRPELLTGHSYIAIEIVTNYADLNRDHWSYDYVQLLSAADLVNGVDAERFAPAATITRAEFTAIIARALELPASGEGTFNDVEAEAWYADAVNAAAEAGIINGKSAQQFNPHGKITRQEMAVIMSRAYEFMNGKSAENGQTASFSDMEDAGAWAIEAIAQVEKLGIIQGSGKGKFNPQNSLSRAEAAKVIAKLLYL
jgi:hypothetical protein